MSKTIAKLNRSIPRPIVIVATWWHDGVVVYHVDIRPMSKLSDRITFNPKQCGGKPCIRGMRIRVSDILDMLAGGASRAEILKDFAYLEDSDITAALQYAAAASRAHTVIAAE